MRSVAILVTLFVTVVCATPVHAASEDLDGRVLVGVEPIGVRIGMLTYANELVLATQSLDVAGRIGRTRSATVWLGGELTLAASYSNTSIEPGVFFLFTFERLFRVPIVPMFRIGVTEAQVISNSQQATLVALEGELKFGASLYYFVTPRVGLGFDATISLGFGPALAGQSVGNGAAFTDLCAGMRFAM